MTIQTDVAIIGGGIVGLATAYRLQERYPNVTVTILEKEGSLAFHQTGRNSGVLHSGIYYRPGSLRATNCREGTKGQLHSPQAGHLRRQNLSMTAPLWF